MRKKVWIAALFLILALAVAVSLLVTVSFGSTELSLQEVYAILYDHLFADDARVNAGVFPLTHLKIVWQIRLPRTIFALLVGAGLSVCGGAMQSLVLNPIADPYVLGISSGASAGAALALLTPISFLAGQRQTTAFAFLGALLSAFTVYYLAKKAGGGKLQPVTLLLSGTFSAWRVTRETPPPAQEISFSFPEHIKLPPEPRFRGQFARIGAFTAAFPGFPPRSAPDPRPSGG